MEKKKQKKTLIIHLLFLARNCFTRKILPTRKKQKNYKSLSLFDTDFRSFSSFDSELFGEKCLHKQQKCVYQWTKYLVKGKFMPQNVFFI